MTSFPTGRGLPALLSALALAAALTGAARGAAPEDKSTSPPNVIDGAALVQALRGGGHVLYFRHARTDLSTQDSDRSNLANCSTQRRLSDEGRQQMRAIGGLFRSLGVPVANVYSSPYCRSIETVQLAFGKATIDPDLAHTVAADEATAERQARALRKRLAEPPAPGTNTVLSGHTGNLQEAAGIWPSPEGVAIVFRPDGRGGFVYLATVPPEGWAALERSVAGAAPR